MGIFEKIFPRPKAAAVNAEGYFKGFTEYRPQFRTWGGQLYESELVRAAVDARARHISKLEITLQGSAKPKMRNAIKLQPNEFQTWGQFLYRLSTILDMQNTAFIVPVFDTYGEVTGVYPILPSSCEVVQSGGDPWLRYTFQTGGKAAIKLTECGVMSRFQYKDDFFGEKNTALTETMKMMDLQSQAVNEAVTNSNTYRFLAQVNNFTKPEDLAKERKRFTSENLKNDGTGGLLLFPNTYTNIQQIKSTPYVVDAAQLELIRTNVFNYFGVNEDILQNKAYGDSWNAFYEGCVEAFSIQFSDVMTKMLFTPLERVNGSGLFATSNRMQYMSNADKLAVSTQLVDRGVLNRDDARAIWNLPPLPNGEGQKYMVLAEYVDAKNKNKDGDSNASQE